MCVVSRIEEDMTSGKRMGSVSERIELKEVLHIGYVMGE